MGAKVSNWWYMSSDRDVYPIIPRCEHAKISVPLFTCGRMLTFQKYRWANRVASLRYSQCIIMLQLYNHGLASPLREAKCPGEDCAQQGKHLKSLRHKSREYTRQSCLIHYWLCPLYHARGNLAIVPTHVAITEHTGCYSSPRAWEFLRPLLSCCLLLVLLPEACPPGGPNHVVDLHHPRPTHCYSNPLLHLTTPATHPPHQVNTCSSQTNPSCPI